MVDEKRQNGESVPQDQAEPAGEKAPAAQEEPIKILEAELKAAKEKAQENWDLFLRARADFDNYRKNMEREREATIRRGKKDVFLRLLDIRDNLERALSSARTGTLEALISGVEIILRQVDNLLRFEGIEPIEAVGKPFDPAVHEAVASWESPDVVVETCTDEIQKGFTYQGEVLRAARVRVAKPEKPSGVTN